MIRASAVFTLVWAASAACGGCKAGPPADEPPAAESAVQVKAPVLPADHLALQELLEGPERVYGLALPRDMKIDQVFAKATLASGPVGVHPLVDYFRARLHDGDLREGASTATFEEVTVPGKPDVPLAIHIAESRGVVRVEIRDVTPPALPALPDDEARWKHAGLTATGRVLDPTHLD